MRYAVAESLIHRHGHLPLHVSVTNTDARIACLSPFEFFLFPFPSVSLIAMHLR